MTTTGGSVTGASPADGAASPAPSLADGTQLLGEMAGSGYRVPPALARRADGQVVQLTPLLYAVLASLDGQRDYDQVAEEVRRTTGRPVSEDNAAQFVDKLRGYGLVASADGSEPVLPRSNPLLALRFKKVVTGTERTHRLTAPFAALFNPLLIVALVALFLWICWWVLFDRGLAGATHDAFQRPGLLLAVLAVTVFSAGFHEFGHAAAAQRGGAPPAAMGVGLYLIWPAFYTDVTNSYRLGRGGRLRTDLGGLYFNAIVACATAGVWWLTSDDALLLLVATQILQMLHQLVPLVRFDGYHVLADLTGVPDLFQRIGPTLKGLLPWHWRDPSTRTLKPWARAVVTLWVLVVVPVLAFTLFTMVTTFPRIVGSALASFNAQRHAAGASFGDGQVTAGLAHGLAAAVVLLPVAAMLIVLFRFGRQILRSIWRRTQGKPVRRGIAAVTILALIAGILWAWWPTERHYRPVQAWEGGRLTDVLGAPTAGATTSPRVGSQGAASMYLPNGSARPTREHPVLALVLIPRGGGSGGGSGGTAGNHPWIFPINQPLAPGPGDNQAVSVNTKDDTASYSVAFAMVWADGSQDATNANEAYALASCKNCAAVAVAFQVVFVTGHVDVAIPKNHAVALNYNCTSCLTYALAIQLFVTLDHPLSADATKQLAAVWRQLMSFAGTITTVPLSTIQSTLDDYESQIADIAGVDLGDTSGASATPSDGSTPSPDATDTAEPSQTPGSSSSPSEAPSPEDSGSAAPSDSAEPSGSASSSP